MTLSCTPRVTQNERCEDCPFRLRSIASDARVEPNTNCFGDCTDTICRLGYIAGSRP